MNSEEIAQYLLNTPAFFDEHAETLAKICLPHPNGGRTVSLSERQLFTLREKNKALDSRLHEMIEFTRENEALQHNVHEFTISLFAARDLFSVQELVIHQLRDLFAVPHAALHLWQLAPPGEELLTFASGLSKPVCMHQAAFETASWFANTQLRSFAYLPLRAAGKSIGMLVLASEEKQRFYPEMGTVFLQRLSEAAQSALHPYLEN
jgi:hypothetical protein